MPARRLSDIHRTAFVTGASGGLGRAFVEMLLDEGVAVWGTARDPARLNGLFASGKFTPVGLDLGDGSGAVGVFAEAAAATERGVFDLVIQNAGYGVFGAFEGISWDHWQRQLETMLITTARLSHAAMDGWAERGGRGCLVHVSSMAVEFPIPFLSGYNVAKAGLSALSESLEMEMRGGPISVIDFRPGDYRTGFNRAQVRPRVKGDPVQSAAMSAVTERVWTRLEENLEAAPEAPKAAADLRAALMSGRSGVVRSGGFFQTSVAPFLARFGPRDWRVRLMARYFNLNK